MTLQTEDEAKERWCPLARTIVINEGFESDTVDPHNRVVIRLPNDSADPVYSPPDCRCIASACMAWRWSEETKEAQPDRSPDQHKAWLARRQGYCGAFGKP